MSKKGQNLRIFVDGKCVAVTTNCQFHIGIQLESSTTHDSVGMYDENEPVGKSWDVSCDALYDPEAPAEDNAITPAELMDMLITAEDPRCKLKWDATDGEKNRTGKNIGYTGDAYLNDGNVSSPDRNNVNGTFQFTGTGPLTPISGTKANAQVNAQAAE